MKKVLLTNLYIEKYSGSELDTVTVANYFVENGWDVTIFTLVKGYPLINDLIKKVKIYDYYNVDEMNKEFDLIWAHHFPVLDYLIFNKNVKADYIHFVSLSSYEPYEALPLYYKKLNLVSTLSGESLDVLKKNRYDYKNVHLFTNYSFKRYFELEKKYREKIKKICIVSNHIPLELLEFKEIAEKENIVVDIYGEGYKFVKINENILKKYDVVISIGKTVNYSLSLGIPTYCYDRFGGDGYIDMNNINKSYYYNFSGRYSRKQKKPKDIYNDIVNNYERVLKQKEEIKKYAYDNFCFENNIQKVLKEILATEKLDMEELINDYEQMSISSAIIIREFINKQEYMGKTFKTYYFTKDGKVDWYSFKTYRYDNLDNKYSRTIKIKKDATRIRIDLCNVKGMIIKKIKINGKNIPLKSIYNAIKVYDGYISLNNNPYIILDNVKSKLEIEVIMNKLDVDIYLNEIIKYSNANEQLNQIVNSKGWKMLDKIRKLMSIVRKR